MSNEGERIGHKKSEASSFVRYVVAAIYRVDDWQTQALYCRRDS